MKTRYLDALITEDALKAHKIAFISGPRQVGKTTLAKNILKEHSSQDFYFNWDDDDFRKIWIQGPKSLIEEAKNKLIVFDEVHKDRKWKNKIKGLYDLYKDQTRFIVTGSAKMDYYRKSGDSLQGRYFPYRLHPFTMSESHSVKPPPEKNWGEHTSKAICDLNDLLHLGGFPEPLWGQNQQQAQRWRKLYRERMIRIDARDLQNIREISSLENLALLLPNVAACQLSYESLRQDLSCSFESVVRWIELLEALYFCYRIRPYSNKIKNSLKREPKLYFYDWPLCAETGPKWENLIAGHLIKNVHLWTDAALGEFELFYLRDKQKREVDFLITKDKAPYLLLEAKSNQSTPTPSLYYYKDILKPKFCIQLVKTKKQERKPLLANHGIEIMEATRFLQSLN